MKEPKLVFSQEEMRRMNIEILLKRGVTVDDVAKIAHTQQSKYSPNIPYQLAVDSVLRILSYRDCFHAIQLGAEIDRLAEEGKFEGPIQDIINYDLGLFGVDEVLGLELAGNYGAIGRTNFGDIDVNKPGIVYELNERGKENGCCHTFLDDLVGALAAAASTRIAQVVNEEQAHKEELH